MREEQANLTSSAPAGLASLLHPPDEDLDGEPDRPAVRSVHVGVVSTDMGAGAHYVPSCDVEGDDGVLLHDPGPFVGCADAYPAFLTFDAESSNDAMRIDFECLVTLGAGGCGWEQPFAAFEKAVTVHAWPMK